MCHKLRSPLQSSCMQRGVGPICWLLHASGGTVQVERQRVLAAVKQQGNRLCRERAAYMPTGVGSEPSVLKNIPSYLLDMVS